MPDVQFYVGSNGNLIFVDDAGNVFNVNGAMHGGDRELTIASGAITVLSTDCNITVDTESDASTDNLDTINDDGIVGQLLIIGSNNQARDTTLRDGVGGNLFLDNAGNFALVNTTKMIVLIRKALGWYELTRSDN